MKAYRIGRKQGSWVNRTPPIRGGVFRLDAQEIDLSDSSTSSDTDDNTSLDDAVSSASSSPSVDVKDGGEGLRQRAVVKTADSRKRTATLRVANAGVAREIQNDLETYPSLDTRVQDEIARKYQLLHQRIHDEGLYQCPYVEYGKEMMRYTTLFTLFGVLFYNQWYITSAVFLGLFWVCRSPSGCEALTNLGSIKSCSARMMLAILRLRLILSSTLSLACSLLISAVVYQLDGGRAVTTCTIS